MQARQLSLPLDSIPRHATASELIRRPFDSLTPNRPPATSPAPIATGEKAKVRDVLAAIRTLKQIEQENRLARPHERELLARFPGFPGFGAVALGIFPDPVTGRDPDAAWQVLRDELKSLLTPTEYDSLLYLADCRGVDVRRDPLAWRAGKTHRPGAGLRHRQVHETSISRDAFHRRGA